MNLQYDSNVLVAAERAVGKSMVSIIEELGSDSGTSLTTLRALVAAGRSGAMYPGSFVTFIDEHSAGKLIDEKGTAICAEAVGQALKSYFERGAA